MRSFFALLCLVMLLSAAAPAEDAAGAFPKFCEEWMQKLDARQRHNVSHIKWESRAEGVQGAYVGYSAEHTCKVKGGGGPVAVGTITYREVRYEKRGGTIAEAEQSPANPVEITEVTEIFRYSGGKWVY